MVSEILGHTLPKSDMTILESLKPYVYGEKHMWAFLFGIGFGKNNFGVCGFVVIGTRKNGEE